MSVQRNQFLPNSRFPEGKPVPQRQDILEALSKYDIKNASQIKLIDENKHFVGLIDFNLAGTEVVVDQMANVAGFDYHEEQQGPVGAQNRLVFALNCFQKVRSLICFP